MHFNKLPLSKFETTNTMLLVVTAKCSHLWRHLWRASRPDRNRHSGEIIPLEKERDCKEHNVNLIARSGR